MKHSKLYNYLGIPGALAIPALAVAAVNIPNVFNAGDNVSASAMNQNFTALKNAHDGLETQVATLQTQLAEARAAAGFITQSSGKIIPYYRKVLKGSRSGSTTTTIPHGIAGNPSTQRRFLGCEIIVNYDSGGPRQTINLNSSSGGSTPVYCDMDDTNLVISWYYSTALDYQVSLLYTAQPLD